MALAEVRPQKVEQREEENPYDVYEVPVEPEVLHGRVVLGRVTPLPGPPHYRRDDAHADYHVQRVQARHGEVEPEEHLVLADRDALGDVYAVLLRGEEPDDGDEPVVILLSVLVSLDAEEDEAEQHG